MNLQEAKARPCNPDWMFNIAYAAIINLADAALKSEGFRIKSSGHHYYSIQSLEYTVRLDSKTVELIDSFRELRHKVTYV
jgi:hypothetical protein